MNHDLRCFYGDSISAQQLMIVATLTVLICGSTRAAFAQSDSERNRELGRKLEPSQQIIEEMAARIQKLEMSDSPPRASDPSAPSKVAAVTKLSARERVTRTMRRPRREIRISSSRYLTPHNAKRPQDFVDFFTPYHRVPARECGVFSI